MGQVYVTVQADANMPTYYGMGSGSATTTGVVISWDFEGGITGNGWSNPVPISPIEGNVEDTNAAVSDAYNSLDTATKIKALNYIIDCVI